MKQPIARMFGVLLVCASLAQAQPATQPEGVRGRGGRNARPPGPIALADIRTRDICILADQATKTYYMVGPGRGGIMQYTSKDLAIWDGPRQVYTTPPGVWGDIQVGGIWAPEIHKYKEKYYLFFTYDTRTPLADLNPPTKAQRSQRPMVHRGSTIAVSDSPTGPYKPVINRSIPPTDWMTLDGTLWVEDGQPYMIFAHEWLQVTVGTFEAVKLKDDLTGPVGEPFLIFKSSDAPWAKVQVEGGTVTDGCYFRTSKSGKLFMVWSSFDAQERYNVGLAISDSGKLAGPWQQEPEALFVENGGHPMLFETFEGKLMLLFHAPNNDPNNRPRIFEVEDTGQTLKMGREFTGAKP